MGRSAVRDVDVAQPGVRLVTLVTLRWIAIGGQLLALAVVALGLGFPLPIIPALLVIGASIVLNLSVGLIYPRNRYLSGREAGVELAFDLLQLGALLFLTGGLANPFTLLMLVPVTVSATLLSWRNTVVLVTLAICVLSALAVWSLPLPWRGSVPPAVPMMLRIGDWVALVLGMAFLCTYTWRVSAEARRRRQALVATQAALDRARQMTAVGALAAAAAHELGSPLGTITLIAKDLVRMLGKDPHYADDVQLLNEQVTRCREILLGLSQPQTLDDPFHTADIEAVLREVMRPHETGQKIWQLTVADAALALPVPRSPELVHGLENFIGNAARYARSVIEIEVSREGDDLRIRIGDDGPGFPADILLRLGEPYIGSGRLRGAGMGLGVFIGVTLMERIGARVRFYNDPGSGAVVDILWHNPVTAEARMIS